jgi:uncharacterized protein (TIGR03437 family)
MFPLDPPAVSRRIIPVLFLAAIPLHSQILVDTFAGGKIRTGIPAQQVYLSQIDGLAWAPDGALVFCDKSANLIRRIRSDGILETIAGAGTTGFSGDGGPALQAELNQPSSPRFDPNGNLYFADTYNYRIRRIDTDGIITTIAGNGVGRQDGMDLEGPALARSIAFVNDLAAASDGSVYFTEQGLLRRVTPSGRIQLYAHGQIANPELLAVDDDGNLYVADSGGPQSGIYRISPEETVTKFAGFGQSTGTPVDDEGKPALGAFLYRISALAAGAAGNVYFVQEQAPIPRSLGVRIRRINTDGTLTTILGSSAGATIAPYRIAVNVHGDVAFADSSSTRFAGIIRKVTAGGRLETIAGGAPQSAPDGTPARDAWFLNPSALAFHRNGDLYIADSETCLIRKISVDGLLQTAAGTGKCGVSFPGQPNTTQDLTRPASIAFDSRNRLYMLDSSGATYIITPDGHVSPASLPLTLGPFGQVAVDAKDRVYVMGMFSLVRVSPDGKQETIVNPPSQPGVPPQGFGPTSLRGLGTDSSGRVYFTGSYLGSPTDYVFRVNDDGTFNAIYGSPSDPLYLFNSLALAADANAGVWLARGGVSVVNNSGILTIGRQDPGNSGDGGLAQNARFNTTALTFGPTGDLYLIDNNRIRRLTRFGVTRVPTIASSGIVNALSYTPGPIAPGELLAIFGSNFGSPDLQINPPENNRIPWSLGRTKVLFNGYPGAITAVTPNQINVFAPYWLNPDTPANIVVQVDAVASVPVTVPVAKAAPGLASIILNEDGSINSAANPAARGSRITLIATGEGLITPQLLWGSLNLSPPSPSPVEPVTLSIGGQPVTVESATALPRQPVGLIGVQTRIPGNLPPGTAPVTLAIGGIEAPKQAAVAIR